MRKIIILSFLMSSLISCKLDSNFDLQSINENIFKGIKDNNLELLKPYFFNNDNIKLCKDAFGMTDENIERFRKGDKAPYATYELLEKIRNEDDQGKIDWKKTEFINVAKFNDEKELTIQKTKQAEIYTTYIPFSEGNKKWKLTVKYLKTEKGFFVLTINDEHFQFKE